MTRPDPYRTFRFVVEIDGTEIGGFQTVSGVERQTQVEPYREGGANDFEHQLVLKTTYPALSLRRGLVDTWMWDWHQDVIAGRIQRRTVSIILMNVAGEEAWRWICEDAYPAKWSGAELDAVSAAVATETVELVHHGIVRQS
jgi:phage tail-like protein